MVEEPAAPDNTEPDPVRRSTDGDIGYEIFMAGLSVLSIINLVLGLSISDEALSYVIMLINLLLTLIFMLDFLWRLFKAESKRQYLVHGYGWADFLSSLPFSQTNVLRLFRLIRVYRLLNDYGARAVGRALIKDRAETALLMLLLVGILVLEFGSLQMLRLEQYADGANITTASDAVWYVIVTMATVGYGDQYPTTNPGRLLGSLIIIVGVGIFGTLTGYLANLFLSPRQRKQKDQPTDLELRLQELKDLSARQAQAIAELENLVQRKDR
jgi:voltage-gated potassium channel